MASKCLRGHGPRFQRLQKLQNPEASAKAFEGLQGLPDRSLPRTNTPIKEVEGLLAPLRVSEGWGALDIWGGSRRFLGQMGFGSGFRIILGSVFIGFRV